eukprot:scaffold155343_cov29-Tisochrysis_lutea.AAC.3
MASIVHRPPGGLGIRGLIPPHVGFLLLFPLSASPPPLPLLLSFSFSSRLAPLLSSPAFLLLLSSSLTLYSCLFPLLLSRSSQCLLYPSHLHLSPSTLSRVMREISLLI